MNGGGVRVPPLPVDEDDWVRASERLRPQWQSIVAQHRQISIPVPNRGLMSSMLQVFYLEMSAMLKEQLVKVFSLMKPGMLLQYEPELDAFLEFLIWRCSIWVDKLTPVIALMNLRYRNARAPVESEQAWKDPAFLLLRKFGIVLRVLVRSMARWAWVLVQRIEGLYKAASFGILLIFLYKEKYRNLIERALKARLVYDSANMNRAVSFEYMNRQLVWNEFSDKDKDSGGDESICPICQSNPSIPFLALPCRHRYCNYCLRTRCAATSSCRCPGCNEPVVAM